MLEKLGNSLPNTIAAVPLLVRGKVAGAIYADNGDGGQVDVEALEMLSAACGLTLEIILLGGRKDAPAPASASNGVKAPQPAATTNLRTDPVPGNGSIIGSSSGPSIGSSSGPSSIGSTSGPSVISSNNNSNGRGPSAASIFAASSGPFEPPVISDSGEIKTTEAEEAHRIARLLVQEIVLYNQAALVEGRKHKDLYNRLRDDIDRSRAAYDRRVSPKVAEDFFYAEMVTVLGEGDASRLGNCPGPRAVM
jgi:hypothetical protein